MPRVEKITTWTLCKEFEASTLEAAIKLAETDASEDWEEYGDPETSYLLGQTNG